MAIAKYKIKYNTESKINIIKDCLIEKLLTNKRVFILESILILDIIPNIQAGYGNKHTK